MTALPKSDENMNGTAGISTTESVKPEPTTENPETKMKPKTPPKMESTPDDIESVQKRIEARVLYFHTNTNT